jgi:8-oxo-dGTP pyrophosphatase MutT (NUDIX family)
MLNWVRQAAVIPVFEGRVCLVTSRNGRRWVLPKGRIDPGHTPEQAALIEAWEEAGIIGTLDPDPVGSYVYEKLDRDHHVQVFRMTVTETRDEWPERPFRKRAWVSVHEVAEWVEEPDLRELLRRVLQAEQPA